MKEVCCITLISGLLAILLSFIENKFYKKNRQVEDYLKLGVLVSGTTFLSLYYGKDLCNLKNTSISYQDITTGNPNF